MSPRTPPQELAFLFPALPAWALAPFLGGQYLDVPFAGRSNLRVVSDVAVGRSAPDTRDWRIQIRRRGHTTLEAQLLFGGFPTAHPFGANEARIRMPKDGAPPTISWDTTCTGPTFYRTAVHTDLLLRWQAISDPAAQQAIVDFWLGHEHQGLAELGLAALQLAITQPHTRPGHPPGAPRT
jgi:hypothetical protein